MMSLGRGTGKERAVCACACVCVCVCVREWRGGGGGGGVGVGVGGGGAEGGGLAPNGRVFRSRMMMVVWVGFDVTHAACCHGPMDTLFKPHVGSFFSSSFTAPHPTPQSPSSPSTHPLLLCSTHTKTLEAKGNASLFRHCARELLSA